jgi:hypothetical protein
MVNQLGLATVLLLGSVSQSPTPTDSVWPAMGNIQLNPLEGLVCITKLSIQRGDRKGRMQGESI